MDSLPIFVFRSRTLDSRSGTTRLNAQIITFTGKLGGAIVRLEQNLRHYGPGAQIHSSTGLGLFDSGYCLAGKLSAVWRQFASCYVIIKDSYVIGMKRAGQYYCRR